MPRKIRDAKLDTRTAREKLPAGREFWKVLDTGLSVGYRKGPMGGAWIARVHREGVGGKARFEKSKLGIADDREKADGVHVLSWGDAQERARVWAAERRRDWRGDTRKRGATVRDAAADYLAWCKANKTPRAYALIKGRVDKLILPRLGDVKLEALTSRKIEKWMHAVVEAGPLRRTRKGEPVKHGDFDASDPEALRKRKATANRIWTHLRAILNRAYDAGDINSNPWRRVKSFVNADAARVRFLSADDAKKLVAACDADFALLVRAALLTGLRFGELTGARVGDFDPASKSVFLRQTKTGKPRHVPLAAEAVELLTEVAGARDASAVLFVRADGGAWQRTQQKRRIADACARAEIAPVRFHELRHSFASFLINGGVPLMVVASLLGHGSVRMCERFYGHLKPELLTSALALHVPNLRPELPDNVTRLPKRKGGGK